MMGEDRVEEWEGERRNENAIIVAVVSKIDFNLDCDYTSCSIFFSLVTRAILKSVICFRCSQITVMTARKLMSGAWG
jgi:hypothetical protein